MPRVSLSCLVVVNRPSLSPHQRSSSCHCIIFLIISHYHIASSPSMTSRTFTWRIHSDLQAIHCPAAINFVTFWVVTHRCVFNRPSNHSARNLSLLRWRLFLVSQGDSISITFAKFHLSYWFADAVTASRTLGLFRRSRSTCPLCTHHCSRPA